MKLAPSWFTYRNVALAAIVLVIGSSILSSINRHGVRPDEVEALTAAVVNAMNWLIIVMLLCTHSIVTSIRSLKKTKESADAPATPATPATPGLQRGLRKV